MRNISACPNPVIGETIVSPLPVTLDSLYACILPIHISVAIEGPSHRFIGLSTLDWLTVFSGGVRAEDTVDIVSLQSDTTDSIEYSLTMCGINNKVNYIALAHTLE